MEPEQPKFTKVQLIDAQHFYVTLVQLKVRKSMQDVPNLRTFLTYPKGSGSGDSGYPPIMLKKLIKAVEEFMKSDYFKSYGTNKLKLAVQEPVSITSILKREQTQAVAVTEETDEQDQTPKQAVLADSEEEFQTPKMAKVMINTSGKMPLNKWNDE